MLAVFMNNTHTQVASAIAQGKRAHTYIWYDTWGNMDIAKTTMDYFCHVFKRLKIPSLH